MPPKSKSSLKAYSALFLTQRGDVELGTVQGSPSGLTMDAIQAHYKKRQVMEPIGTYVYKAYTLFLFGSGAGKEGQENQHQLPPPYDMGSFYMDILILASKDEDSFANPVPFQVAEYETFYTKSFGGYTSEDSEEEIAADEVEIDDVPAEEEKDFAVEEEEIDSDDEEDDDNEGLEGAEGAEGEVEAEDEPVVKKAKVAKKKKVVKNSNSVLTGTATAYPDKPILSEDAQLQEEECLEEGPTVPQRKRVVSALQVLFKNILSSKQILDLESSIYNGAIKRARGQNIVRCWTFPLFAHVYSMHAKQISANFSPNSYVGNKELFERYKAGEITLADLSRMDIYELLPTQWEDQFKNRQIREKRQLEGNRSMATDIFLCTKCWKRECTYYEMQTRSADEPMTIFITCLNCGKHWRQ